MNTDGTCANFIPDPVVDDGLRSNRVDMAVKKSLVDGAELACHLSVGLHAGTVLIVLTAEDDADDGGHKGASSIEEPHDHQMFLDVIL